ncbi:MAG: Tim44 domain-containing protein [Candidatus Binatia bacterium]
MVRYRNRLVVSGWCMLLLAVGALVWVNAVEARAGGGRSFGSRGSRSFSAPARPSTPPAGGAFRDRSTPAPSTQPYARTSPFGGGSLLRGIAGGLIGGMIGSMLFRSLGFASYGPATGGWGGPGLFDLLLLGLLAYVGYRWFTRRSTLTQGYAGPSWSLGQTTPGWSSNDRWSGRESALSFPANEDRELDHGVAQLRVLDPNFDQRQFCDQAMDFFFRLQAAWSGRDLTSMRSSVTDQLAAELQNDLDRLKREQLMNRVENIAVRTCDITEAWQETGQDLVTVYFYANCLDYDVNETSDVVVRGSKTEPTKFEEFWTFTRPAGGGTWRLSAITQA